MRNSAAPGPVDLRRRDFLIRCCQGASAALIPASLHGFGSASLICTFDSADRDLSSSEFHLHPHYRMPRPLDALLLKTQAGLDDFVTEKYADQIAAILAQWSSGLLQSPQDVTAIERVLLPNFSGSSPQPVEFPSCAPGPGNRSPSQLIPAGNRAWARRISAGTAVSPEWLFEDSYG